MQVNVCCKGNFENYANRSQIPKINTTTTLGLFIDSCQSCVLFVRYAMVMLM